MIVYNVFVYYNYYAPATKDTLLSLDIPTLCFFVHAMSKCFVNNKTRISASIVSLQYKLYEFTRLCFLGLEIDELHGTLVTMQCWTN